VLRDGEQLGPVGCRVVGEVLVGIIDSDPESFRSVDPEWQPTLPDRSTQDPVPRMARAPRLALAHTDRGWAWV
jgi:hypothetical protein